MAGPTPAARRKMPPSSGTLKLTPKRIAPRLKTAYEKINRNLILYYAKRVSSRHRYSALKGYADLRYEKIYADLLLFKMWNKSPMGTDEIVDKIKKQLSSAKRVYNEYFRKYASLSQQEREMLSDLGMKINFWRRLVGGAEKIRDRLIARYRTRSRPTIGPRTGPMRRWVNRPPDIVSAPIGIDKLLAPGPRYYDVYSGYKPMTAHQFIAARKAQSGRRPLTMAESNASMKALENMVYFVPVLGPIAGITKTVYSMSEEGVTGKKIAFLVLDIVCLALDAHYLLTIRVQSAARTARTARGIPRSTRKILVRAAEVLDPDDLADFYNIVAQGGRKSNRYLRDFRKLAKLRRSMDKLTFIKFLHRHKSLLRKTVKTGFFRRLGRGSLRAARRIKRGAADLFYYALSPKRRAIFKADVAQQFVAEVTRAADISAIRELAKSAKTLSGANRQVAREAIFKVLTTFNSRTQRRFLRLVRNTEGGWGTVVRDMRKMGHKGVEKYLARNITGPLSGYTSAVLHAPLKPWLKNLAYIGAIHGAFMLLGYTIRKLTEPTRKRIEKAVNEQIKRELYGPAGLKILQGQMRMQDATNGYNKGAGGGR